VSVFNQSYSKASMKLWSSPLLTLAAFSYAIFGGFGIATWCVLLTNVPTGTTALDYLEGLLQYQPEGQFLGIHAAATAITSIFAVFLFVRPPASAGALLRCAVAAICLAAMAWFNFAPDVAMRPSVAAMMLTSAWRKALRPSSW